MSTHTLRAQFTQGRSSTPAIALGSCWRRVSGSSTHPGHKKKPLPRTVAQKNRRSRKAALTSCCCDLASWLCWNSAARPCNAMNSRIASLAWAVHPQRKASLEIESEAIKRSSLLSLKARTYGRDFHARGNYVLGKLNLGPAIFLR